VACRIISQVCLCLLCLFLCEAIVMLALSTQLHPSGVYLCFPGCCEQHESVFLGTLAPAARTSRCSTAALRVDGTGAETVATGGSSKLADRTDAPTHVVLKVMRDDSHELAMLHRSTALTVAHPELAVVPVLGVISSFAWRKGKLVSAVVMPWFTPLNEFVTSTCVSLVHIHVLAFKLVKVLPVLAYFRRRCLSLAVSCSTTVSVDAARPRSCVHVH
jgi:hypothetical protein